MRDKLLKEIYRLEAELETYEPVDLKTLSNDELLVYYGNLRIEDYLKYMEEADERARSE